VNDYFQYDYVLHVNDYFQYDYIHVNDYFQYDYIRVNDYFPKAVRGTSLQRLALHRLCTATPNKVPPRLACLIQGITAHWLTPSTVSPLGTY
jgi:hypothetical protein